MSTRPLPSPLCFGCLLSSLFAVLFLLLFFFLLLLPPFPFPSPPLTPLAYLSRASDLAMIALYLEGAPLPAPFRSCPPLQYLLSAPSPFTSHILYSPPFFIPFLLSSSSSTPHLIPAHFTSRPRRSVLLDCSCRPRSGYNSAGIRDEAARLPWVLPRQRAPGGGHWLEETPLVSCTLSRGIARSRFSLGVSALARGVCVVSRGL